VGADGDAQRDYGRLNVSHSYIVTEQQQRLDLEMLPYDIWGTRAHVRMLHTIGVFQADELQQVLAALSQIESRVSAGTYQIDPDLGAQLTLEKEITELVGREIGGKVHTGRSRNDQVTTAQKLYFRDKMLQAQGDLLGFVGGLVALAEAHVVTVMPGYTHMQPAKPTSFGQWALAYADMFLRDVERLEQTFERHNTNPLGAAESYGSAWPLDRQLTADLMGFGSVQEIPLDAIATRGEMEAELLSSLSFVNLHLSKFAQDLLMLNTFEFGMVELGQGVAQRMGKVTGSSIMPQKKNPDVLELIRANASMVYGLLFQTLELLKSLPFGYNRDSRETKETATTALRRTQESLVQALNVAKTLCVNKERMREAVISNYSLATDLADYLASNFGLPYRTVYLVVGKAVDEAIGAGKAITELNVQGINAALQAETGKPVSLTREQLQEVLDPEKCLARRQHIGGAAPEQMATLIAKRRQQVEARRGWVEQQQGLLLRAREAAAQV
jgi:argininosuccinate lyase